MNATAVTDTHISSNKTNTKDILPEGGTVIPKR